MLIHTIIHSHTIDMYISMVLLYATCLVYVVVFQLNTRSNFWRTSFEFVKLRDWGGKRSLMHHPMLVEDNCCSNIDSRMENAAGIEPQMLTMYPTGDMYGREFTFMPMRADLPVDDAGAPGQKIPSSVLARDPDRGQGQGQGHAPGYAWSLWAPSRAL